MSLSDLARRVNNTVVKPPLYLSQLEQAEYTEKEMVILASLRSSLSCACDPQAWDPLWRECATLHRLVYKGNAQHRRSLFFQRIRRVQRDIRKLTQYPVLSELIPVIVSALTPCQDSYTRSRVTIHRQRVPTRQYVDFVICKVLGAQVLLAEVIDHIDTAARHVNTMLRLTHFMPYAMVMVSTLARVRHLLLSCAQPQLAQCYRQLVSLWDYLPTLSARQVKAKANTQELTSEEQALTTRFKQYYPTPWDRSAHSTKDDDDDDGGGGGGGGLEVGRRWQENDCDSLVTMLLQLYRGEVHCQRISEDMKGRVHPDKVIEGHQTGVLRGSEEDEEVAGAEDAAMMPSDSTTQPVRSHVDGMGDMAEDMGESISALSDKNNNRDTMITSSKRQRSPPTHTTAADGDSSKRKKKKKKEGVKSKGTTVVPIVTIGKRDKKKGKAKKKQSKEKTEKRSVGRSARDGGKTLTKSKTPKSRGDDIEAIFDLL